VTVAGKGAPQAPQKRLLDRLSAPQVGQVRVPLTTLRSVTACRTRVH
jgi:hypothetical protein